MTKFKKRLKELGFNNYQEYLKSNYWKEAKKRYYKCHLPRKCVGCNSERFQLHHRSYVRLGNELPRDLIPLCGDCHTKVHFYLKYLNEDNTCLAGTHKILRKVMGWSRIETRKKFRSFSLVKKGYRWIPLTPKQEKRKLKKKRKPTRKQNITQKKYLKAKEIQKKETEFLKKKNLLNQELT